MSPKAQRAKPRQDTSESTPTEPNWGKFNGPGSDSPNPQTAPEQGLLTVSGPLSKHPNIKNFELWIEGTTPLITKAWSYKAKSEMLGKQLKATKPGRETRNPEQDYKDSLYPLGDANCYGFPVTGIKNAILSSAHKDKGIPKTQVMSALYFNARMSRVATAYQAAICDLPLVRIYGDAPIMREDPVRVGVGLGKTATLTYRGQFTRWAIHLTGELNTSVISFEQLMFLLREGGKSYGIGEWRNEHKGVFGAFRIVTQDRVHLWEAFAAGNGPIPDLEDLA
jgi:hypothetical protein